METDETKSRSVAPSQSGQPYQGKVDQSSQPDQASRGEPTQVETTRPASLVEPSRHVLPVVLALPSLPSPTLERETPEEERASKFTWENVKILKGKNLRDAKKYLANHYGKHCTECGLQSQDEQSFDIHHIDGNRENNKRWNLRLTDHPCNARLNGNLRANRVRQRMSSLVHPVEKERENVSVVGVRERVTESVGGGLVSSAYPGLSGTGWSGREGEKADEMRPLWNHWIRDKQNGPFCHRNFIQFKDLKFMAVHALGMGSSITYSRYIHEDAHGGPLELYPELGKLWVRFIGDKVQKLEPQSTENKVQA